jgi:hypothetical protein
MFKKKDEPEATAPVVEDPKAGDDKKAEASDELSKVEAEKQAIIAKEAALRKEAEEKAAAEAAEAVKKADAEAKAERAAKSKKGTKLAVMTAAKYFSFALSGDTLVTIADGARKVIECMPNKVKITIEAG